MVASLLPGYNIAQLVDGALMLAHVSVEIGEDAAVLEHGGSVLKLARSDSIVSSIMNLASS